MNTIIYEELLVDKSSIFQELYCTICSNLIKNAHQCNQGGHLFCEHCIKEWLKTQTTCPSCRCLINFENLSKNRLANNLVGNLKIYCSNGCNEIICIDQLESHLQICGNRFVNCPQNKNCGSIRLNTLDQHLETCRFNYINNCLYRNSNDRKVQREEKEVQFNSQSIDINLSDNLFTNQDISNCNNNNNTCNHNFNLDYLNYLQTKVNEFELNERNETIIGDSYGLKDDINHGFDWIIQNYNEKIKMMGEDGYFEIIPFENLIIRFYPNKTEYFTTPCKVGVHPIEIMSLKFISKCLIPLDLKLIIQSPINREATSVLKKDLDLEIKFDKINNIKSDLKLSFIINLKKKYLNLFTS